MLKAVIVVLLVSTSGYCTDPEIEVEEIRAIDFLQLLNRKTLENNHKTALARWAYHSNITNSNRENLARVVKETAKETKEFWNELNKFNWRTFTDHDMRRQFAAYSILGAAALPEEKLSRLHKIITDMEKIYSTAKICAFNDTAKCNLTFEPDITAIFANSDNSNELQHSWVEWRKAVGPHSRHLFKEYVDLSNEAARLNNLTNYGEYCLRKYETEDIREQIDLLWQQVRPLYVQLHAYARHHLRKKHGDAVSERGPIPAHLLGDLFAQQWLKIAEIALPFPEKKDEDLSEALRSQNYTVLKIFKTAEEFFKSINLSAMTETFWERSIFEKPKDRDMLCVSSAEDFYDGDDFRIKQCSKVSMQDFAVAHHEMGRVEYFMQYKHQPTVFRNGANPGFHEAVGDLIALSATSRKHLQKLNLLKHGSDDPENALNTLLQTAMEKIVFLPFAYVMDLWQWEVFAGKVGFDDYNCKWWELREEYQGVEPPVNRTDQDFDPASKYHTVADAGFLRHFISVIVQFQFHRSLCEKAGEYDPNNATKPLHECDIYGNLDAGNILKKMLSLGASRPWPEAMEIVTGQRTMNAGGLLEYFKPLQKWLEDENKKNGAYIGWEKSDKVCVNTRKEAATTH